MKNEIFTCYAFKAANIILVTMIYFSGMTITFFISAMKTFFSFVIWLYHDDIIQAYNLYSYTTVTQDPNQNLNKNSIYLR